MDGNSTQALVNVDPGARQPPAKIADEKLLKMYEKLQRTENLLGQMAGLQQAISRELAELSSEIGYSFRVSLSTAPKAERIDDDGGDGEGRVSRAGAPEAAAATFPDSGSAAPSPEDSLATATPEVAFVPWGEMTTTLKGLVQYTAIEVPTNEPVGTFDPGTPWNRLSDPTSIANRGGLLPERIQINSPSLKAFLKHRIGKDEAALGAPAAKPFILLRPFKMLFYHETSLKNALDKAEEEKEGSISELQLLVGLMESRLRPCKESLENIADTVAFSDLWYIFPPGSPIYVQNGEFTQKVWCVVQRTGGRRYLKRPDHIPEGAFKHQLSPIIIDCYFVDFDGRRYVPVYGRFEIRPYHGLRTLTSLSAFPLRIAVKKGLVDRDDLISRGKEFVSYRTVAHRYYDGWSHTRTSDGRKPLPEFEEKFDSEVIVDFALTLERQPGWRPLEKEPDLYEMDRSELGDMSQDIDRDWVYDKRFSDRVLTRLKETLHSLQEPQTQPDDDFLLLLPDRVLGYVLRTRKFGKPLCDQRQGQVR